MSKHWLPNSNVVPLRGRKRWTRTDAYWAPAPKRSGISGASVAVMLFAAVSAGLAVGLGWTVDSAAPARVETSEVNGVRLAFSYCHSGGGTNCVVDGDTFYIDGDKVRIAGIDAPETHPPRCAREARLGEEATERLHGLLNSGAVTMTGIDRDRDVYGRLLRNVAVDGQDVGDALIAAGVAREYGRGRRGWC